MFAKSALLAALGLASTYPNTSPTKSAPAPQAPNAQKAAPKNAATPSPTQTGSSPPRTEWGIGLACGPTLGAGLSFRMFAPSGFGLAVSGLAIPLSETRVWSLALEGMWTLKRWPKAKAYALLGAHSINQVRGLKMRPRSVWRRFHMLAVGPGVGIEGRVANLSVALELPVVALVALTPESFLRFQGRVNVGVAPNLSLIFHLP